MRARARARHGGSSLTGSIERGSRADMMKRKR